MTKVCMRSAALCSVLAAICSVRAASAANYWVDQVVNYESCTGTDLYDDTYKLVTKMQDHRWTGTKWVDADAWPQDFREHCSTAYGAAGLDIDAADSVDVAVFSGHGSAGRAKFGFSHSGVCRHDLGDNGRLGSMDGADASIAMWLSCSTLDIASLPSDAHKQWVTQHLGFHDTVGNNTNEYASFFVDTCGAKANAEAWLDRLEDSPAIVVTYDDYSQDFCWLDYEYNAMCMQAGLYPRGGGPACGNGQPEYWYCGHFNP